MVPMAPSSTRMRSAARPRSVCSLWDWIAMRLRSLRLGWGARFGAPPVAGTQPQQMADRIGQVGAVHRVEVEIGHTMINQIEHLLGGDRGGDQLARCRIVVEAVEAMRQPIGYRGAGAGGEIFGLLEILYRQDAGHDRNVDAGFAHAVEVAEVKTILEKEL